MPYDHERVAVLEVQVPCIPPAWVVFMQLEDVARRAEDLAPDLLVPDRAHDSVVADLDTQELVLQRRGRNGRTLLQHLPSARRNSAAGMRCRVEHRKVLPAARDRARRPRGHALGG